MVSLQDTCECIKSNQAEQNQQLAGLRIDINSIAKKHNEESKRNRIIAVVGVLILFTVTILIHFI